MPERAERPERLVGKSDHRSAWLAAERYGVDVSLLKESLRKTPEQRLRDHGRALRLAEELRRAVGESG